MCTGFTSSLYNETVVEHSRSVQGLCSGLIVYMGYMSVRISGITSESSSWFLDSISRHV